MSNPLAAPRVPIDARNAPSAFWPEIASKEDRTRLLNPKRSLSDEPLSTVSFYIRTIGMPLMNSVVISSDLSIEERYQDPKDAQSTLATAQLGGIEFTRRSGDAYRVNTAMWRTLPVSGDYFYTQAIVGPAMKNKFYVAASTQLTRGRFLKYYKKNLSFRLLIVPTQEEVADAMIASGCVMVEPPAPYNITLNPDDPDAPSVRINMHSDNGYPVGGSGDTEGALERVLALAAGLREELEAAAASSNGAFEKAAAVEQRVYEWHLTKPQMVLVKGKCKQDYYTKEKLEAEQMRFYNALPRQLVLIMQQATQALEAEFQGLFEHPEIHSAQKIHLVRGGADKLIETLDEQLNRCGYAYVHVGDDSWVVLKDGWGLVMCALDCSSFDLTQHSSVTLSIHRAFRDLLALIDPVSAGVWMAFARKRLLVIEKTLVVSMEHGGPSGMPMQSKVNDVLMEVLLKRFVTSYKEGSTEDAVDKAIKGVGSLLGLTVKVEQFSRHNVSTVREALRSQPFQFIGYYFSTHSSGFVYPFLDLPRTMSQSAYPSGKWVGPNRDFKRREAMRLTSIAMGSGIAPEGTAFQTALFQECSALLAHAVNSDLNPGLEDPRLRWATQVSAQAMHEQDLGFSASLLGLQAAFAGGEGVLRLWKHPQDRPKTTYSFNEMMNMRPPPKLPVVFEEDELPSESRLVPIAPISIKWDFKEVVLDEDLAPPRGSVSLKTAGRFPRLKRESREAEYRRKGQEHKLQAETRRMLEQLDVSDIDPLASAGTKRATRQKRRGGAERSGNVAAARSRLDEDAPVKDLRAGRRRRKKK